MNKISLTYQNPQRPGLTLRDFTCIVVAITIFLSIGPFFAWSSFAGGVGVLLYKGMQIFSIMLLFLQIALDKFQASTLFFGLSMLGIFVFYWLFTGVKSGTTHQLLIGNVLVYVFYALNVMTDRRILVKSFGILQTIFAVVLGYTILIHVLVLCRLPLPYTVLQSGEAGRIEYSSQFYQNYFGCLLINHGGNLLYRFTSVFTEPGVVGTFCAFFLASNDCDFKKIKKNTLFLISGLLSFSVAFYVMFVLIYTMKAWRKGGYKLFCTLLGIVIVYSIFINLNFSNSSLVTLQERLTITESGLVGDNRIKEVAEASYQSFLKGDLKTMLFGYGAPDNPSERAAWQATASYKESVYCLGVLGYGLMIAWFILAPLICYKSKDKEKNRLMYSYMIIFIASQYQRPYMKALFLVYILLAGSLYARSMVEEKNTNQDFEN